MGPIHQKKFHPKIIIACHDNNNLPKINKSWCKIFAPALRLRKNPKFPKNGSTQLLYKSCIFTNLDGVVDDSFAVAVVVAAAVVVVA